MTSETKKILAAKFKAAIDAVGELEDALQVANYRMRAKDMDQIWSDLLGHEEEVLSNGIDPSRESAYTREARNTRPS